MTATTPATSSIEIPPDLDPFLVDGGRIQRRRLAQLSSAQRAALVLERYPELRALPNCDWQRLSVGSLFGILFRATSRHFAQVELAALAGILASAGVSSRYMVDLDAGIRSVLNELQQRFGIHTAQAITLDMWESWGRDTNLMHRLVLRLARYSGA